MQTCKIHSTFLNWLNLLFYLTSSDQSEMADWLKSKSLTTYQVYPRLKTVTKTFLDKAQHESSAQKTCCTL